MMNRGTMVFSLNTIVFGEEVAEPTEPAAEAVEETRDEADESADVVEDASEEEETDTVASVDAEATVDATTNEADGIKRTTGDDDKTTVNTTITYALDSTDKKATVADVVTITNTTDPVSWNNAYAKSLLYTVLFGTDKEDEYLNNSSKTAVSENSRNLDVKGLRTDSYDEGGRQIRYEVIPVTSGESYILVGYRLLDRQGNGELANVVGQDTYVAGTGTGVNAWDAEIPVIEWDGRKIDFNKSGLRKQTGSKKEALDVAVSLVTYSSGTGTVTEIPGITVGGVKIDKKAIKAASVAADYTVVKRTGKYPEYADDVCAGINEESYIDEYATLSDVPSFTVSVKTKGTDAKSYKKSITDKLKNQQFYFGIQQKVVNVYNEKISPAVYDVISKCATNGSTLISKDKDDNDVYATPSANDVKAIEDYVADSLKGGYTSADREEYSFSYGDFTISKFNGKKANLVLNVATYNGKKTGEATVALKAGKDYSFESGSLAGEDVSVLTFPTGGNYVYAPAKDNYKYYYSNDEDEDGSYNLTLFDYKYAFRVSPADKKKFRYGVYADSNSGFVYSAE